MPPVPYGFSLDCMPRTRPAERSSEPQQLLQREVRAAQHRPPLNPAAVTEVVQLTPCAFRRPPEQFHHDMRRRRRAVAAVTPARTNVRVPKQILERAAPLHFHDVANLRTRHRLGATQWRQIGRPRAVEDARDPRTVTSPYP